MLIDGQDIGKASRASLRRRIAYVSQETFLFKGSVGENIAMGRPGATREEIVEAAKAAHAHEFIIGFARGYDSPCGEHGMQLSGGQRQRIAIARAFLKNAPIILLDEATSALDSESEHAVQEALKILCAGRTTLVIAHRLTTILNADRICVIENGEVAEIGRHDELMARGGAYFHLHQTQFDRETALASARRNCWLRRRAISRREPTVLSIAPAQKSSRSAAMRRTSNSLRDPRRPSAASRPRKASSTIRVSTASAMAAVSTEGRNSAASPLISRKPPEPEETTAAPPACASRQVRPNGSRQIDGASAIAAASLSAFTSVERSVDEQARLIAERRQAPRATLAK